jgi:hypothetical protein
MLIVRTVLSVALMLCGAVIVVRMLEWLRPAGWEILPGVFLGAAMIALGAHRLSLILRARGSA